MILSIKEKQVLYDDNNHEVLSKYRWRIDKLGYVFTAIRRRKVYMHKILLQYDSSFQVADHINGNKLDNRKENLRIATQQENSFNRKKAKGLFSSIYKGVSFDNKQKKWRAGVWFNSKHCCLLSASLSEIECAYAYNIAACFLGKEFARINHVIYVDLDFKIRNEVILNLRISKLLPWEFRIQQ